MAGLTPRLRSDEASSACARFVGTLDGLSLYKRALSQDAIRGLLWFLHGSNDVVIPRGIFYDSKLYGKLNGTFNQSSPFAGATAYGNSNTLSSNLNGRVIQMVIAKNLTLAQAWGILDLARTQNSTGNVTAFPFFATSEFYTLGLSWEVSKLAANTSVVNGGNWTVSPPPPPPSLWQLFWNTVAGWAERVWNAAVAVGAFFTNVGKWLIQAALAYVKGLTTGDWQDFQNQVLEPIQRAFQEFVDTITELIGAIVSSTIGPLVQALRDWMTSVLESIQGASRALIALLNSPSVESGGAFTAAMARAVDTISKPLEPLLLAFEVLMIALAIASGPVAFLVGLLVGLVSEQIIDLIAANMPRNKDFDYMNLILSRDPGSILTSTALSFEGYGNQDPSMKGALVEGDLLSEAICGMLIIGAIVAGLIWSAKPKLPHGTSKVETVGAKPWKHGQQFREKPGVAENRGAALGFLFALASGFAFLIESSQKPGERGIRVYGAGAGIVLGIFGILASISGKGWEEFVALIINIVAVGASAIHLVQMVTGG